MKKLGEEEEKLKTKRNSINNLQGCALKFQWNTKMCANFIGKKKANNKSEKP